MPRRIYSWFRSHTISSRSSTQLRRRYSPTAETLEPSRYRETRCGSRELRRRSWCIVAACFETTSHGGHWEEACTRSQALLSPATFKSRWQSDFLRVTRANKLGPPGSALAPTVSSSGQRNPRPRSSQGLATTNTRRRRLQASTTGFLGNKQWPTHSYGHPCIRQDNVPRGSPERASFLEKRGSTLEKDRGRPKKVPVRPGKALSERSRLTRAAVTLQPNQI